MPRQEQSRQKMTNCGFHQISARRSAVPYVIQGWGQKEEMLHEAQCWDTLAAIHLSLRAEASVHDFQNANLRGQEALLHASDVLDAWKRKQELAAKKYRRDRSAVLALCNSGPWMHEIEGAPCERHVVYVWLCSRHRGSRDGNNHSRGPATKEEKKNHKICQRRSHGFGWQKVA